MSGDFEPGDEVTLVGVHCGIPDGTLGYIHSYNKQNCYFALFPGYPSRIGSRPKDSWSFSRSAFEKVTRNYPSLQHLGLEN